MFFTILIYWFCCIQVCMWYSVAR